MVKIKVSPEQVEKEMNELVNLSEALCDLAATLSHKLSDINQEYIEDDSLSCICEESYRQMDRAVKLRKMIYQYNDRMHEIMEIMMTPDQPEPLLSMLDLI